MRKGRTKWQERVWRENDEKILKALTEEGLTKTQLRAQTGLAWRIITKHLEQSEEIVSDGRSQKGRRFYLKSDYIKNNANLQEEVTRLEIILELLRMQQDDTRDYERALAQARRTLHGHELYERLDEIHWAYLSQKQEIIRTLKTKGIRIPEWEKKVKKAIAVWKEMQTPERTS